MFHRLRNNLILATLTGHLTKPLSPRLDRLAYVLYGSLAAAFLFGAVLASPFGIIIYDVSRGCHGQVWYCHIQVNN